MRGHRLAGALIKTLQGDLSDLYGYPWPWSISQCLGQSSKYTAALSAVITSPSLKPKPEMRSSPAPCCRGHGSRSPLPGVFLAADGLCDSGQVPALQVPYLYNQVAVPFSSSLGFVLLPLVLGSKLVASSQAAPLGFMLSPLVLGSELVASSQATPLGFVLSPLVLGSDLVASSQAAPLGPEAFGCQAVMRTAVALEGLLGIPDLPLEEASGLWQVS